MTTKPHVTPSEPRSVLRLPSELRVIVQVKEGPGANDGWKEITKVMTVSRNGAGFGLSRKIAVGRLVYMVMPLVPELRAYDEDEKLYQVVGIVQHCSQGIEDGQAVFHTGVAFIGKEIPASFGENPQQGYRINGMSADGLWKITEADKPFKARRHPRYWSSVNITVTVLKKDRKVVNKETTYTQNVGSSGAAIVCSLDAAPGDKVKLACKEFDFFAVANVRNRTANEGEPPLLHVEFDGVEFPVDKLQYAMKVEPPDGKPAPQPKPEPEPASPPDQGQSDPFEFARF